MRQPTSTQPPVSKASRIGFWALALFWVLGTVFLIIGAFKQRYAMTNIDGISYIRIGEHWAAGRFDDAVNAYWSPMISWCMVPFMAMGADAQLAFMLVSATWSSIGVAAGTYFVFKHSGRNFFSALVVEVVIGVLCASNLMNLTPDLLVVAWVMIFAWVLTEVNDRLAVGTVKQRILAGVLLGVTCAIGYFIKQFLIPVFIVVLLGWLVVRFLALRSKDPDRPSFRSRAKPLLVLPLAAVLTLVIVAAPWVTALSIKYGYVTVGSSFSVNTATKLDASSGDDDDEPEYSLALESPPNDSAISFSEDRTFQVADDGSGSADSSAKKTSLASGLAYYGVERLKALPHYLNKLLAINPFGVSLIAVFALALAFGLISARRHRAATITASIFVVYFLGYLGLTSAAGKGGNLRYYWPMLALSTATAMLMWPAIWRRLRAGGKRWRQVLAVVLICLIPTAAITQHGMNTAWPFATGQTYASVYYMLGTPEKPEAQVFAEKLVSDGVIAPGSKIVGGKNIQTLIYAFYMRAQIYGRNVRHDITDPAFQQVMRDKGIEYYFLYRPTEDPLMDVSSWGTIIANYDMGYTCGGTDSEACRLSIVKLTY